MATERRTETHHYFWGGRFSNFYKRPEGHLFSLPLWRDGPLVPFYHSEGYYMAMKAMLFGDVVGHMVDVWIEDELKSIYVPSNLENILAAKSPKDAKEFGRAVKNFNERVWSSYARTMMFRACWGKFSQNPDLARVLFDSGKRVLVEGSPLDKIWGVGIAWNDPAIEDHNNWQGMNWLGEVLMLVRDLLYDMDHRDIANFDPFMVDLS